MKNQKLNKDFYNELPGMVCEQLGDVFIKKYLEEDWFEKAWEEYRQHVMSTLMDEVRMPYYVFKNYIKEEKK